MRLLGKIFYALAALFSGGCSLVWLSRAVPAGSSPYESVPVGRAVGFAALFMLFAVGCMVRLRDLDKGEAWERVDTRDDDD